MNDYRLPDGTFLNVGDKFHIVIRGILNVITITEVDNQFIGITNGHQVGEVEFRHVYEGLSNGVITRYKPIYIPTLIKKPKFI